MRLCCTIPLAGSGVRGEGGSHHQRGGSVSSDALLEGGAVERGVAKLFRGKVTPFGSAGLRFTQSAALSAIAIVGLKSLVEYVRLMTLCKEGRGLLRTALPLADTVLSLPHNGSPMLTCSACSYWTHPLLLHSLCQRPVVIFFCLLQACTNCRWMCTTCDQSCCS